MGLRLLRQSAKGGRKSAWLCPMRWIEMVAIRKGLQREIGKHLAKAFRHSREIVWITQTTQSEVDRSPESPQTFQVQIGLVER